LIETIIILLSYKLQQQINYIFTFKRFRRFRYINIHSKNKYVNGFCEFHVKNSYFAQIKKLVLINFANKKSIKYNFFTF